MHWGECCIGFHKWPLLIKWIICFEHFQPHFYQNFSTRAWTLQMKYEFHDGSKSVSIQELCCKCYHSLNVNMNAASPEWVKAFLQLCTKRPFQTPLLWLNPSIKNPSTSRFNESKMAFARSSVRCLRIRKHLIELKYLGMQNEVLWKSTVLKMSNKQLQMLF